MAEQWFLKIDGIEGESTNDLHKGEIDVESWSWGVQSGSPASGAGLGRSIKDVISGDSCLDCAHASGSSIGITKKVMRSQSSVASGRSLMRY